MSFEIVDDDVNDADDGIHKIPVVRAVNHMPTIPFTYTQKYPAIYQMIGRSFEEISFTHSIFR